MFDTSIRPHPVQTFQFWFVVLTSFVVVTAWKLDLFSFPSQPAVAVVDEPMPPPTDEAPALSDQKADFASQFPPEPMGEPIAVHLDSAGGPAADHLEAASHRQANPLHTDSSHTNNPQEEVAAAPQQSENPPSQEFPNDRAQHDTKTSTDNLSNSNSAPDEQSQHEQSVKTADYEQENSSSGIQLASAQAVPPSTPKQADAAIDLAQADLLIASGEEVAAQRLLSTWYWKHPEARPKLMDRLNVLARRIYFLPEIHYTDPHVVKFGENLDAIANRYAVSPEYLMRLNRLSSPTLKAGHPLKVIQGPFSAVVDVSDMEMTIHAQGYYVARFQIGIGTDQPIPYGSLRITDKVVHPAYHGPDGLVSGNTPANPLGKRWLTVSNAEGTLTGFGIHGSPDNAEFGVTSGAGAVRLKSREMEAVYDLLTVGSELIIHP